MIKNEKTSLIEKLTPMEYCKNVISYTIDQIKDFIYGRTDRRFSSLDFFGSRQCNIVMKNGTVILWSVETWFGSIEIPDLDEIEYVSFSNAPFYGEDDDFDPEWDESYGIINLDYRNSFNSIDGLCKEDKRPEQYHDYVYVYRPYIEFPSKDGYHYRVPDICDSYAGAVIAEYMIKGKNSPELLEIHNRFDYSLKEYFIYRKEFCDGMKKLAECFTLNDTEKELFRIAYYYIESMRYENYKENLTLIKIMAERDFGENKYEKIWKIPRISESELVISDDPTDILCIALWAVMNTDSFEECVMKAMELTKNDIRLANAVIWAGAFSGSYHQFERIPDKYKNDKPYSEKIKNMYNNTLNEIDENERSEAEEYQKYDWSDDDEN